MGDETQGLDIAGVALAAMVNGSLSEAEATALRVAAILLYYQGTAGYDSLPSQIETEMRRQRVELPANRMQDYYENVGRLPAGTGIRVSLVVVDHLRYQKEEFRKVFAYVCTDEELVDSFFQQDGNRVPRVMKVYTPEIAAAA